ncbi:protein DA1-related 1-like isoform X2 [Cynara cardunculus var. scolymus]|uniref:protein DA1-related 1-like isoform X2 n=1 Tax=Cynara cardunculus var. scolymus TaxID=59895 RepID=UPI000D628BDC|nr:protein DA1-related 1-like isoform X2 [Cynara cardunculus var. scolymus]
MFVVWCGIQKKDSKAQFYTTVCVMGWLTKILRGFSSSNKNSGKYHGRYENEGIWVDPPTTVDTLSDFDSEEIDRAIALSLLEEDTKSTISDAEEDEDADAEKDEDADAEKDEDEDTDAEKDEDTDADEDEDRDEDEDGSISSEEEEKKPAVSPQEEDETGSNSTSEEEDDKGKKVIDHNSHIEEDEQLAKAIQESLNVDSPQRSDYDSQSTPVPYSYASGYRICVGCRAEIGHGRFLSCMGGVWHPECFRCHACNRPISDYEFSMTENRPFHKSCYKERHHPKCDVCKNFIPTNTAGLIEYRAHPFWLQKYCPSHEHDGTPRCCSCERMEARDTKYLLLDDGRKLCLECLDSAIMDTHECQPLYLEIQDFYEGLNMKIEQQVPLLLVERQALNEAMEGEKNGHHHMPETRGLCLSEEQTISTIIRRPRVGAGRIMDMFTEPYKLVRRCEVTAILILYSLPRLLTGSILAHEMMHAWLRLKGYSNLPPDVEEGICQVLAHMWLDSEIMAGSGSTNVASSSSSAAAPTSSKKGKRSDFEKQLGEFFKHQIESDTSAAYGDGFRDGNKSVLKYGLRSTLDHIRLTGRFPC